METSGGVQSTVDMVVQRRTAALQPINFVTLTRVTNSASCNWVNLVQVSSVQFSSSAVNTALCIPPQLYLAIVEQPMPKKLASETEVSRDGLL